tara:strand:- start:22 stop:687 length:666 start_codon:yes stop_codon:yes gene_type:complete
MDITIKDDGVYDIKEVNELTKIPIRNLQRIALRRNIEKAGRSYIFTGAQIKDLWLNTVSPPKDTAIPPSGAKPNAIARATAQDVAFSVPDIQKLNLDEIEDFEFKFRREGEFPKLGNFFFVERGKFIVEHTPEQFEIRKKEYQQAEEEIRLNRFKIKSKDERILFLEKHLDTWVGWANGSLDNLRMNLESSSNLSKSIFMESTVKAQNTKWREAEPNKKGK